jgi:hypothetical protein
MKGGRNLRTDVVRINSLTFLVTKVAVALAIITARYFCLAT